MRFWKMAAAAIALALLVLGIWHWLPARQVRLHQQHLLTALENRQWPRVAEFIAPDYHDAWGHSRARLLEELPQVFQDFLACGLLMEDPQMGRTDLDLVVSTRLRIVGSGGPIAQYLISRSETLQAPFLFRWQRASWKPWDWQLVRVDQPELTLPDSTGD